MDKTPYDRALEMALMFEKKGDFKNMEIWLDKAASLEKKYTRGIPSYKENEIALGAAFISYINETIQYVQSSLHKINKASLNKNVTVRTKGCQLRPNDLDIMNTAATIALNRALDIISNNDVTKKNQIVSELWPTTNNIEVSLSLTPENKFVWSLDLD